MATKAKVHFYPAPRDLIMHVLKNPRGRTRRAWCGMVIKPLTDIVTEPEKVTCLKCRTKVMDPKNNVDALRKAYAKAVS